MILAFPATASASVVYAAAAVSLFSRFVMVRQVLLGLSIVVAVAALVEFGFLATRGVLGMRAIMGTRFNLVHAIVFFCTPPAVANIVVFSRRPPRRNLIGTALVTFVIAITFVFWNISVDETLYGPDQTVRTAR